MRPARRITADADVPTAPDGYAQNCGKVARVQVGKAGTQLADQKSRSSCLRPAAGRFAEYNWLVVGASSTMIRTNCPACSKRLKFPAEWAARRVKCQTCGHSFVAQNDPAGSLEPTAVAPSLKPKPAMGAEDAA
jgi:ribosomal protein S27E